MVLTPADWHKRFCQQALWTQSVRQYLYQWAGLTSAQRVIEIGCGTGVILQETISVQTPAVAGVIFGLDLNRDFLNQAAQHAKRARLIEGDALSLPLESNSFDIVVCHYFLLWVSNPSAAAAEMKRICRPGGAILALAEPDYGGRIDYPSHLAPLGTLQKEALSQQGADVEMGRKLSSLLSEAGLNSIETGVLGGHWKRSPSSQEHISEWALLADDIGSKLPASELAQLYQADSISWQRGERVLFVPTFFACGRKEA